MTFKKAQDYIRRRMLSEAQNTALRQNLGIRPPAGRKPQKPGHMAITGYGDRLGPEFAKGCVIVDRRYVDPNTGERAEWETVVFDNNLVVTLAETAMAQMAVGAANSALNYIELGDPSPTATPPQLGDTTLEQSTGQRKAVSLTQNGNLVTAEVTFGTSEANGPTYTEAGLFTGPFAGGIMFARKTFSGILKTAAFELRITWLVTFLVNTQGGDCAGIALTGPSAVAGDTEYIAAGGETSVAATFDFVPNSNLVDVYLNGQRLIPGKHYTESGAPLTVPQGGGVLGLSKGVNLLFVALPNDEFYLIQRSLQ